MLHLISLGLGDEKDITLRGLEALQKCDIVYIESYTSVLQCTKQTLEEAYGKKMHVATREIVETKAEQLLLEPAKTKDVALLVIGDAVTATTHVDLMMRAKQLGIAVQVIHNASVVSAVGITGLQVYKFGKITSIPFENDNVETPYGVLETNKEAGLHTLFLLDLDPIESKFLTIADAIRYLLRLELKKGKGLFKESTLCVACARLGADIRIVSGTAKKLLEADMGKPPYCLIVPGKLHFMEEEALNAAK